MGGVPHILTTPFSQITDILSSTPVSRKDNENIKQFQTLDWYIDDTYEQMRKKNEKTKATSSIYQFTSSVTYKHFGIHIGWEHINQSINNQESWNYMNISKKLRSDPSYNWDQFISLKFRL